MCRSDTVFDLAKILVIAKKTVTFFPVKLIIGFVFSRFSTYAKLYKLANKGHFVAFICELRLPFVVHILGKGYSLLPNKKQSMISLLSFFTRQYVVFLNKISCNSNKHFVRVNQMTQTNFMRAKELSVSYDHRKKIILALLNQSIESWPQITKWPLPRSPP